MSKQNQTPWSAGPWRETWVGDDYGWVLDATDNYLFEAVTHDEEGRYERDQDKQAANLRLAGKAPDLAHCLEQFVTDCQCYCAACEDRKTHARRLLAEIRGKETS